MAKQTFEMTFAGRPLVVEVGQVAKQANGAVVVRYGDTTVLQQLLCLKRWQRQISFLYRLITRRKCMRWQVPGGL